ARTAETESPGASTKLMPDAPALAKRDEGGGTGEQGTDPGPSLSAAWRRPMASPKIIPGSERQAPQGAPIGPVERGEQAEVSIYLKCDKPERPADRPMDRHELRGVRQAALAPTIARIADFARAHGLEVSHQDEARRLVKVSGSLADL